jgi:putative DNA primase/helicase
MKKSVSDFVSAYLERGFYVAPIPQGSNHPTVTNWQNLRISNAEVEQYFSDAAGIALLLEPSGLVDVDLDCKEAIVAGKILLPPTAMVHGHRSSPRSHYYYRVTGAVRPRKFNDPSESRKNSERSVIAELRVNGQTNVPPTVNKRTGETIEWEIEGEPATVDENQLSRSVAQCASAALLSMDWRPGSRHDAALALSGMLLRAGWGEADITKFMTAVATAAHDEETASRLSDITTTIRRLESEGTATGAPRLAELMGENTVGKVREWLSLDTAPKILLTSPYHLSDLGNARRLIDRHGENLRYCVEMKKWLVWTGHVWVTADCGEVERFAKQTVGEMYSQAAQNDPNERQRLARHALKCEAENRLCAMVNLAETEPNVPVRTSQLDSDPWLLNCTNGAIDLSSGRLLPHNRVNLCTKQVSVAFDPSATCPTWLSFLERIMGGNEMLIEFLQRAVGYSLTGMTTEQVLFFLHGFGANGKTTFIEVIRKLLGDYAQQADFNSFLEKRGDGARNDLARLQGARFVAAVEAGEGRRLAETVIKQATGGDKITARFLYREFFEYTPQFKLFLVANHKPLIAGTDEAIWRRIRLVPFTVTIPPEERDKQLLEKLQGELVGILAWAVQGCLDWQRHGLGEPPEVSDATADYRREMDVLADFLDECCVIEERETVIASDLYQHFKDWCQNSNEIPFSQKKFGEELHARLYQNAKKRGKRIWIGLRLRIQADNE